MYKPRNAAEKKTIWYFKGKLCHNQPHIIYAQELKICMWTIKTCLYNFKYTNLNSYVFTYILILLKNRSVIYFSQRSVKMCFKFLLILILNSLIKTRKTALKKVKYWTVLNLRTLSEHVVQWMSKSPILFKQLLLARSCSRSCDPSGFVDWVSVPRLWAIASA